MEMGILSDAIAGRDPHNSKAVTRQDIADIGAGAIKNWERRYAELLSCFRSDGPDGLVATMQSFQSLEHGSEVLGPMLTTPEFQNASQSAQFEMVSRAVSIEFSRMFTTLLGRGALERLVIVDAFPDEAREQLRKMEAEADSVRPATIAAAAAPAAPPPPIDPVDQCVQDFNSKTLGMAAFKRKWVDDRRMRPTYDAAVEAGRI
jgi:hypothetical protein